MNASTDIVRMSLDDKLVWAKEIAGAGTLIPQVFRDRARVLVAIEYGAMLGVHPLVAMSNVYVIEGTPTMSAHLMSATVRQAGHRLRIRTSGSWGDDTFQATAILIRSDDPEPFEATWTKERAARAGLLGKSNWKNYPEAMCKARAISEVCRDGASEALMGIRYTAEEVSDVPVTEAGEPVDITATAVVRSPEMSRDKVAFNEHTGEVHDTPTPAYDKDEADEWAAQIESATELGAPGPDALEADTLYGVYQRAIAAGVHQHLADDPARVKQPKTIEDLVADRRAKLQKAAR